MYKEESKKSDIDYENDFKVVIGNNEVKDNQSRVHQLKSLDSFSRSSESLALSVTSIGESPKLEKERRKKKTRSASRGKNDDREKVCDYGVSRDCGESFISGIYASVRRGECSLMDGSEEEKMRLLNLRLEGKLSVTNQASEEALREQTQLRCDLEIALKEVETHNRRLEGIEKEHKQWIEERESFNEHNIELEKRIAVLLSDVVMKVSESEHMKRQLDLCKETITLHEKSMLTMNDDVAMKETVISELKKKMSALYSQLQLVNLYHENSQYQVEQARLELDMANAARVSVNEQLQTVENVRDQLKAEVQRIRKCIDESKAERDELEHNNQSLEVKLAKLQDARLHDTTQLLFELEQLQKEIIASGEEKDSLEERYVAMTEVFDEKFRELEEVRLRSVDIEKQYDELSQEMTDTKERLRRSLCDIELLESESSDLRKKVASLEVVLDLKVGEIRVLEAENIALDNSLRELRTMSEEKDTRLSDLSEDLTNVRNSLERVSAERDQSTMFIAQLREDCEKVDEQFELSRQALFAKEDAMRLMEEINEDMRGELEKARAEIEASHCEVDGFRLQKDQVTESCIQLQASHSLVRQELDNLRQSLAEAHLTMAGMEEELARLTVINGRLTVDCEQKELQLAQLKYDLTEAQQGIEDLSVVQGQYADLLDRHQRTEAQLSQLSSEHQSLKLNYDWTTKELELRLEERDAELARLVSVKEEVEQTCVKDRLTMERTQSQIRDDLETAKFTHAIELGKRENQYREQLEQSEKEFSQMCQEKIRCESAIGSLQQHINSLVDDYNQRLKDCRTKMLSLEEKSTAYADYESKSRQLMEELARKKGEIEGMLGEWKKMKMHASLLETALARREASVVEMTDRHRMVVDEKDALIGELTCELKKERELATMDCAAKTTLQRQLESHIVELDSLTRQMNQLEHKLSTMELELSQCKANEQSLLDENTVLRETDEQLRLELERRYKDNLEQMRVNLQLTEQIDKMKIAEDGHKKALRVLQEELDQRSVRIADAKKKEHRLVQRHKAEKKEMQSAIKDVQQEKQSLTRTAELSQQQEAIASSVLFRLQSEVKRILFEEEISSKRVDTTGVWSGQRLRDLHQLLNETEVPMKTTKPLSRLSRCIEDLRTQIDSMEKDVFRQFNDVPVPEMS